MLKLTRKSTLLFVLATALTAQAPVAGAPKPTPKKAKKAPVKKAPPMITTESGLKYLDTQLGTGASPLKGQSCRVHYTGWLSEKGEKGKKFDSSVDRGQPLAIPIGVGRVIKGWDEGLMSMKVGGKRTLIIPGHLGYGARGAGADIPPNAELIFEVELIAVQ
ncbi:MAG: FKBP-type peptidyl-prolyl cis-trans isomerase [Geothrix sp.]|nr:FKBP-type peptidyl-prolyl cis-trans isomerase [Geothrix sp.]